MHLKPKSPSCFGALLGFPRAIGEALVLHKTGLRFKAKGVVAWGFQGVGCRGLVFFSAELLLAPAPASYSNAPVGTKMVFGVYGFRL